MSRLENYKFKKAEIKLKAILLFANFAGAAITETIKMSFMVSVQVGAGIW